MELETPCPTGACESQPSPPRAKQGTGVHAAASVPKSRLGWHTLAFARRKSKQRCVCCFPMCDRLSPRGRGAALFPEHCEETADPSAAQSLPQAAGLRCPAWDPPTGGSASRRLGTFPQSRPWRLKVGIFLATAFFLPSSPGTPFCVTTAFLFPTHNRLFSEVVVSCTCTGDWTGPGTSWTCLPPSLLCCDFSPAQRPLLEQTMSALGGRPPQHTAHCALYLYLFYFCCVGDLVHAKTLCMLSLPPIKISKHTDSFSKTVFLFVL